MRNFSQEHDLRASGAQVSVLVDGMSRATFDVPHALGDPDLAGWRVCDVVIAADNTVTINQLQFNNQPAPHGFFTADQDAEIL